MKKKEENNEMPGNGFKTLGVTFSREEAKQIEDIAEREDSNVHAIMKYALLYFIKYYNAGKITIIRDGIGKP